MDTVKSSLRSLLEAHPEKDMRVVARESGVPFWSLYRFARQQCIVFDVENAGLLYSYLTGKSLVEKEVA